MESNGANMLIKQNLELKSNITIEVRERGKLIQKYEDHNTFLNYGRAWVLDLISYATSGYSNTQIPVSPVSSDRRIRYIGFGIGGTGQVASIPAGVDSFYPDLISGTHTDTDPTITELERPVAVTISGWPGSPTFVWEKEITHANTTWNTSPWYVEYEASFGVNDITLSGAPGPFSYVPISEIGLYENSCNPADDYATVRYDTPTPVRPNPVAYHTFYTISKTSLITLTVRWQIRLPT